MLKITTLQGRAVYVRPSTVSSIREADAGGRFHGIRSYVHLTNGHVIESTDEADALAKAMTPDLPGLEE